MPCVSGFPASVERRARTSASDRTERIYTVIWRGNGGGKHEIASKSARKKHFKFRDQKKLNFWIDGEVYFIRLGGALRGRGIRISRGGEREALLTVVYSTAVFDELLGTIYTVHTKNCKPIMAPLKSTLFHPISTVCSCAQTPSNCCTDDHVEDER